jgi:muramidase (phage lysozyme)
MSQNLIAFLSMDRDCEGTSSPYGYRALFGYTPTNGRVFDNDFACHPNIKFPFTQTNGVVNYSTAAGAYQILHGTWIEVATELSNKGALPDPFPSFSPANQDAVAVELIRRAGALADVEAGSLQSAIDKCSGTWASLPASKYPQPKKTYAFAEQAFVAAGGTIADEGISI